MLVEMYKPLILPQILNLTSVYSMKITSATNSFQVGQPQIDLWVDEVMLEIITHPERKGGW